MFKQYLDLESIFKQGCEGNNGQILKIQQSQWLSLPNHYKERYRHYALGCYHVCHLSEEVIRDIARYIA